jgi:hypothetical protein
VRKTRHISCNYTILFGGVGWGMGNSNVETYVNIESAEL